MTGNASVGKKSFRLTFAWIAASHAFLIVLQPILAGMSLDGSMVALDMHYNNAMVIMTVGFIQVIAAVLWFKPGGGPNTGIGSSAFLLVLEIVQFSLGTAGNFALHIPLGIITMIGAFAVARMGFRTEPRAPRRTTKSEAA